MMETAGRFRLLVVFALAIGTPHAVCAQMATAERVSLSGWWPTKLGAARPQFAGPDACAPCHKPQAASQPLTSMARTGDRAARADILRANERLSFTSGPHSYEIVRRAGDSLFTVTDGAETLSAPLTWAFGAGKVGQSFLFEQDGQLLESRVSFYASIQRLDFTPNRAPGAVKDLHDAMARRIPAAETRRCFGCHTTASGQADGSVDFAGLIPGITCEACHGPAAAHASAKRSGPAAASAPMMRLGALDPADSIDFCGSCHATFWDVTLAGERGIAALRSQPYRLQSSACWQQQADRRLTCVACHDPHAPLVRDAAAYDRTCVTCHERNAARTAASTPRICPVSTRDCVTCHMPKYDVPDMHFRFTDHLIRVVLPK